MNYCPVWILIKSGQSDRHEMMHTIICKSGLENKKNATWRCSEPTCQWIIDLQIAAKQTRNLQLEWRLAISSYIVVKYQVPVSNTFWDMNYYLRLLVQSRQTTDNRQTESDAYEPTVQVAQVGSKMGRMYTRFYFKNTKCLYIICHPFKSWFSNSLYNRYTFSDKILVGTIRSRCNLVYGPSQTNPHNPDPENGKINILPSPWLCRSWSSWWEPWSTRSMCPVCQDISSKLVIFGILNRDDKDIWKIRDWITISQCFF